VTLLFLNRRVEETLTAETSGLIGKISLEEFFGIIGCTNLKQILEKNKNNHEKRISINNVDFKKDMEHINLSDLIFIKLLGFGQFGRVLLAKSPALNKYFAIKMISKESIVKHETKKFILVRFFS
jgi:cGMP-dependent protein kinase 1